MCYRPKACIDCGCTVHPRSSQTKRCPACAHLERKRLSREYQRRVAPKPLSRFLCVDCLCLCARVKGSVQIRCVTCKAELARSKARAWAKANPGRRLAHRLKARGYMRQYNEEYRRRNKAKRRDYEREAYRRNPLPFLKRTRRYKQNANASTFHVIARKLA